MIKFWGANRKNGAFSNFYLSDFTLDGIVYPTVEHYFQSKKFEGSVQEKYIRDLKHPAETAREGKRRDFPLRSDWENVKEDAMYEAIKAKFTQNPALKELLLATASQELVENSPYDSYWGVGRSGKGKNRLGILLMELREELRSEC